ncbi:LANO_0H15412g1_1 [Lachancea nothofagi CBS 11611]|uniref:Ribosome biogenesis protein NOP53 n=1 Tax=Lachancea nothofagi CBS 11611 TaxID=1266666 RepID=A0A1G4KMK3_9SACH|nr:LANO_0H15412g1_1 [Lachancea nothofagi CBS 11611]
MAPVSERPAQYKQSSRKGKKAWRKNIDISDIEKSVQQQNDEEITHGSKDLASLANKDLFQVDTKGDEVLKQKLIKRKQIKKNVKSSEILESIKSNSKVAALSHPKSRSSDESKKNKIQGVSKKELKRLMALAGRIDGESKLKNAVTKRGLVRAGANNDLWGAKEEIKTPSGIKMVYKEIQEVPEELKTLSTTGWSKATVAPDTITRAPVHVKDIDQAPHAGKSYNPSNSSWTQLIDKEYKGEKVKEDARLQMEAYKVRISQLMETLDRNEEEESENDSTADAEEASDAEDDSEIKLSLNKPVVNNKKTKYQRNKQRRHKEKLSLHSELKQLKKQLRELERFEELQKTVEEAHATREVEKASKAGKVSKPKATKKHKLGTKHSVMEDNLEVKFSDELSDSLRKLRPEGSLLYDTVRKLQGSGKIESRVPVKKGRRYTPRITEKWTYKDLK